MFSSVVVIPMGEWIPFLFLTLLLALAMMVEQ